MDFLIHLAVLALAAISVANPIEKRQMIGGIHICTGPHFTGICDYQQHYQANNCYNLTGEFVRNVSTFVPDHSNFYCLLSLTACGAICTSPTGCTSGPISWDTPNNDGLAKIGGGWNRLIASFECHAGAPMLEGP